MAGRGSQYQQRPSGPPLIALLTVELGALGAQLSGRLVPALELGDHAEGQRGPGGTEDVFFLPGEFQRFLGISFRFLEAAENPGMRRTQDQCDNHTIVVANLFLDGEASEARAAASS